MPSESQSPQPTAQPGSASKAPETQDNVCTVIGSQSFPQDKHQDSPMIITPPCPIVEQTPNFKDDVLSETQTVFTPEGFFDMEFFLSPQTNENEDVENVVRQTTNSGVESQIVWSDPVSPSMISKALFELALPTEPKFAPESSEMLLMRFDRRTCGILSVKDGISENPWRTLVWPLAKEAPSLYHAICALAAFHCSKEDPQLRVSGMDHMRRSIHTLAMDIRTMRTDTALATTLALTFAESWDRQTSNGIQHLRGAKILVSQALANQRQLSTRRSDVARLRFLYNTWIYTAVIARLTSVQEGGFDELPLPSDQSPSNRVHEIDPLLGCAATLFPLIGRVADLVQKVCSTSTNSIAVISQAIELKTLIEQWEPPKYFEPPEDPTSDIQHSFQTAQAYRWATLLHLHNAVPEIPSESAGELAKRVLVLLATVPLSSRTIVVQIFPLLAASCEIDNEEDRHWVRQRWAAMQTRLMIGNIDRCLEVIHAVWSRRDEYKFNKLNAHQAPFEVTEGFMGHGDTQDESAIDDDYSGSFSLDYFDSARRQSMSVHSSVGFSSPILSPPIPVPVRRGSMNMTLENLEFEKTVRGRLHWLGVMRDWNWEGMA